MNKWLYAVVGLSLAITTSTATQAEYKIAIVNVPSIFQQLPARKNVAIQLENEFKRRAVELQHMEYSIKAKIERLKLDGPIMKPSDKDTLEREVISQRAQLSHQAQIFEQEKHRRQIEERNKILNRIHDAIKSVTNKEGYTLVINANAVAYAVSFKDITADVLKQVK